MDAGPNAWFAGPVAGSASTRTPSTYISGWFEREKLEAPRRRMREPLPTAPVARCMTTPAARALSRSCTPSMGALCVTSAALIVETAFPSLPISTATGVPVTTTCDNSRSFCSSATLRFVSPTFAVSVTARKPIRRTWSTTVVPGRSSNWKRPLASVKTRRAVPATVICTSPIGAPEDRLTTVPATEPPCASTAQGAAMPKRRARPQQTEDNRMARPKRAEAAYTTRSEARRKRAARAHSGLLLSRHDSGRYVDQRCGVASAHDSCSLNLGRDSRSPPVACAHGKRRPRAGRGDRLQRLPVRAPRGGGANPDRAGRRGERNLRYVSPILLWGAQRR